MLTVKLPLPMIFFCETFTNEISLAMSHVYMHVESLLSNVLLKVLLVEET
jgi:hypothetical protein